MRIEITRVDATAEELRGEACRIKDADQARRLLAIALVLDGHSRTDAAVATGMQRQTLRDWVHRYNADGVAGLVDRPRSGRPRLMTQEQVVAFDAIVAETPDVEKEGVVRWRRCDLKTIIEARFKVTMSERSVGRMLNERGFRRLSVRPQHPQSDETTQALFKRPSLRSSPRASRPPPKASRSKSGSRTRRAWVSKAR